MFHCPFLFDNVLPNLLSTEGMITHAPEVSPYHVGVRNSAAHQSKNHHPTLPQWFNECARVMKQTSNHTLANLYSLEYVIE